MSTKVNIIMDQGCTYSQDFTLLDDNGDPLIIAVSQHANADIRKAYTSANVIVMTCLLTNGNLNLSLTANQLANVSYGRYVWNATITNTSSGEVDKIMDGICTIRATV